MSYPVAPVGAPPYGDPVVADPAYSGTFIPEIWSGKIIEKFYDATVLAAISNTDYEGEIKGYGDKVHIRTKATIAIKKYQADQTLVYERPASDTIELLIDQGNYFNTILDDVMEVQADLNMMSMWADDASSQMKITIDTDVLDFYAPLAHPEEVTGSGTNGNIGESAGRISGNIDLGITTKPLLVVARGPSAAAVKEVEPMDLIIRAGQVLDEQNIPEQGRWMVIPSWFASKIKLSELRDASLSGDGTSMLRNGRLGMIDKFTLYVSNLLPRGDTSVGLPMALTEFAILAGHSHGTTFASQLSKVETLRGESTFGTILRGLQVYGRQVVDGKALVTIVAKAK